MWQLFRLPIRVKSLFIFPDMKLNNYSGYKNSKNVKPHISTIQAILLSTCSL